MDKLLKLLTLQDLRGSRSQVTIFIGGVLTLAVQMGWITLDPEQLDTINKFILIVLGYFFVEKVDDIKKKP